MGQRCCWSTNRSVANWSAKTSLHEGCDIETAGIGKAPCAEQRPGIPDSHWSGRRESRGKRATRQAVPQCLPKGRSGCPVPWQSRPSTSQRHRGVPGCGSSAAGQHQVRGSNHSHITKLLRQRKGIDLSRPSVRHILAKAGTGGLIDPQAGDTGNGRGGLGPEASQVQGATTTEPSPCQRALWEDVKQAKLRGLSLRATARELGIHRNTVRRYALAESPPLSKKKAQPGSNSQRR